MTTPSSTSADPVIADRLPSSLLPALQEYDGRARDLERDALVIIERALEHGDSDALKWLFGRYGESRIREIVADRGARHLSPRAFGFWRIVLEVDDVQAHPWISVARATWPYRG